MREMKLSGCQSLEQVPDMSGAPNLEKLHLDSCKNLVEVHDSVGFLERLEDLNLNRCTSLRVLPSGINLPSLKTMSVRYCTSLECFPEILGKMENVTYLGLSDSGITELPFSIGYLVGLANLTIDRCNGLLQLPSNIFMLPKLVTLEAYSCKRLTRVKKGKGLEGETMSSNVRNGSSFLVQQRDVDLGFCYLSEEFLATLFPCLQYITNLSLDYSSITILPSCINACRSLKKLTLNNCLELQEIRVLPPNLNYLQAINCMSLTSQSKEMILEQALLNFMVKYMCFPGSTIPCLFNHYIYRRESSLSFKFRNELPAIALCVVGVLGGSLPLVFTRFVEYEFDLIINGNQRLPNFLRARWSESNALAPKHIIMLDLELKARPDMIGRIHFENGWNFAEISLVKNGGEDMKWMIVHVRKQKTNMADIQFINPEEVPIVGRGYK